MSTRLGWHGRPDFLILGAQKAGTSALHAYLLSHPKIAPPSAKELYYFSPESFGAWPGFPGSERYAWLARGHDDPSVRRATLRWYHAQFPIPLPLRRRLNHEATACYLSSPDAPGRIHRYRPDLKFVVLLRDPVERAYSAWNMLRGFTFEPWNRMQDTRSFGQALREEIDELDDDPRTLKSDYLRRGIYHEQLARYFTLFPREQFLVLEQSQLLIEPATTVNAVCRFLGLEPFRHERAWPSVNVGTYESAMSASARGFLSEFYAPHNEALFRLLGREFAWGKPAAPPRRARAAG
jgi:hypothetical protein